MWQKLKGRLIITAAGAVGIFFLMGIYADFENVRTSFLSFRWSFLPLILALAFVNYLLRFFKWDFYLRVLGVDLNFKESLAIFFAGLAMSLTPAKFGEVLKSFLVKQKCGVPMSRTAPIVFAERFTDFVALVVLSLLGFVSLRYGWYVPFLGLVVVLILFGIIFQRRFWKGLFSFIGRFSRASKVVEKLQIAYESTVHLLSVRRLGVAVGLSIPAWLAEGLAYFFVFRGLDVPFLLLGAVFIYSFSTLVGAVTMLPGGVGGTEGSLVALTIVSGVTKPVAVSSALLVRLCTLWFAVLLGLWVLVWHRKKWETATVFHTVEKKKPIHDTF